MTPTNPDRHVLDASAVLAYLRREPGYERVSQALAGGAAASTVNLAEVYGKVRQRGFAIEPVAVRLAALGLTAEPFTDEDARRCGELVVATASLGLSLGDRACLSLAARLRLPVLTADRAWAGLPTTVVTVRVIR